VPLIRGGLCVIVRAAKAANSFAPSSLHTLLIHP
jgi:hypothetical protein